MKKIAICTFISLSCLVLHPVYADENRESGFGFGMSSGTPERSGNNYGWGFGPADDYPRRDDGIEQSSATGGMSWGNGSRRYRDRRPFFSFGPHRDYYGPPPHWYGHPGWGPYPPQPYPYGQPHPQPQPAPDSK